MFERSLEEQNISPRSLEFSSLNSILRCVKKGVGLAVCPRILVQKKLAKGHLRELLCREIESNASVIMIWHQEKWCSPLLREFMEISKRQIK